MVYYYMGKASRKKTKGTPSIRVDENRKPVSKVTLSFLIIFILLLSFAVYFNSLSNGFVYDDMIQVLKNRWITDVKYIPQIFSKNVWSFLGEFKLTNYYRPVMHLIYMLDYHIFGFNPWGFHLVNILFHAGVSVLVFVILLRLLGESTSLPSISYTIPPLIAAILFATHPIHTEAVTWVAGLPDVSFTFFYLLSFYLYVKSTSSNIPFNITYLLSVASFFLAALCKEPALTLPFILIGYDYAMRKEKVYSTAFLKKYIPYFVIAGVYLIMRFHALGDFAPRRVHAELTNFEYIINIFPLFTQYLEKLVLPINLNAFYVFHPISSLSEANGILSFIIAVAFVVFIYIALRRNKMVFLGLLFIIVPLLPVLYIPGLGENTFTERYLYLPSFGFVILGASLLGWLRVHNRSKAFISITLISLVLIGLYSTLTINRNKIWKDEYELFSDTVRKSPDGWIPHLSLGVVFYDKGQIDEALEQFQIALKLNPNFAKTHNNLGNAYSKKGRIDEAIEQYQIALKLNPDYDSSYNNLGIAFFKKGEIDKAIEQYMIALKLNPNYAQAYNNLGNAFLQRKQIDEAIEQYQIALKLNPDYDSAYNDMGVAFFKKGLIDKAIEQYQIALKLNPNYAQAYNNLGNAFLQKGQIEKAIKQLEIAVKLNPTNLVFRRSLDRAYEQKNLTDN